MTALQTAFRCYSARAIFLSLLLIISNNLAAKTYTSLNDSWQFTLSDASLSELKGLSPDWQSVTVPHTWNSEDPFDEKGNYLRGQGWYQRSLIAHPQENKHYWLKFEGANQVARVYLNGQFAGQHMGGYTAFMLDITELLNPGTNTLQVSVSNAHNDTIVPLKGDFNFYGGLYRDVWLVESGDTYFNPGEYSSSGVYVKTDVSAKRAEISVTSHVATVGRARPSTLTHRLYSPDGKLASQTTESVEIKNSQSEVVSTLPAIPAPLLWHPAHPYLYRLVSELTTAEGKILDRQQTNVGFRWFHFDADEGFFLNGAHLKLMGTNRHQDRAGLGNALSNSQHRSDITLARRSGSNFLRTAHYPQDEAILDATDKQGMLVSMEIPLDHDITDTDAFYRNTLTMHKEMIHQYFNHPSIIIWAYMNEMLLGRNAEKEKEKISKITAFARELESVTRREDPSRYTMIPNHGDLDLYQQAALTDIPMLVGWNLYYGWYDPDMDGLGKFLDRSHKALPDKPMLITEYGAGSDPRIRSLTPTRFDFSIEWQARFIQRNLEQIMARPYVAGSAVWNLFDFGSTHRNDAVPKINSKGLMSFDRQPKDSYWLLQSWLSNKPLVRIGSKSWQLRAGKADTGSGNTVTHTVPVYGNVDAAELWLNGSSLGEKNLNAHQASWQVPFTDGANILRVTSKSAGDAAEDFANISMSIKPPANVSFDSIYINAGSKFYFVDQTNDVVWMPDEAYQDGFWGFSGGDIFYPRSLGVGTDKDILNTQQDPLFQTQRHGNFSYRFDVLPGRYTLTLLMATLAQDGGSESGFTVHANGKELLNTEDTLFPTPFSAQQREWIVDVGNEGLTVVFDAKQGKSALSAISLVVH